jgi:WS/DGAT/MGAT family acyltransferase
MPAAPRRLNDADAMFLAVEEAAGVPMAHVSIGVSESGHDAAQLAHLTEALSRLLPAQKRRIAKDPLSPALPRWVDVPGFDASDNQIRLPRPPGDGSLRALLDWAADWSKLPMDPARPPWRSVTFEGFTWGGRSGLEVTVSQTHHAIVDGMGAMRLGQHLLQFEAGGAMPEMPEPTPLEASTALERWKEGWADEGRKAAGVARTAGRWLRWAASEPTAGAERALEWAKAMNRVRTYQSRVPHSPLLARRSTATRFDLLPVDWPGFRAGCTAAGASVNDGFLGALSVGLHRYHLDHGYPLPALRTAMAINTRTDADAHGGNQVIGVLMEMPLHDDVGIAIKECGSVSRDHRDDTDVLRLIDAGRRLANRLPKQLAVHGARVALDGCDLQVSNVQGIPVRHWIAGAEQLDGFSFPTGAPGVSMTFITSRGGANLGISSCPDSVHDPEHLVDCLAHGFEQVARLAP